MKAIFYKEWIKTRSYIALITVAHFAMALYAVLKLRYISGQYDAVSVWSAWIYKGYSFYSLYQYLPLFGGLLLGCAQFMPELRDRRLRLVLHLPIGERRAVTMHLAFGLATLLSVAFPALLLMYSAARVWFPPEFAVGMLLTLAPWILSGFGAYFFSAAVLLEGRWTRRILLVLVAAGVLRLFFQELSIGSYERVLAYFILWTAAAFCLPIMSSERFRKGC